MQSEELIKSLFWLEIEGFLAGEEEDIVIAEVKVATKTNPLAGISIEEGLELVVTGGKLKTYSYKQLPKMRARMHSAGGGTQHQRNLRTFARCAARVILNEYGVTIDIDQIEITVSNLIEELLYGEDVECHVPGIRKRQTGGDKE